MNIIYNPTAPVSDVGAVVAFGTFDGLHMGHMMLMQKLKEIHNLCKIIFTFRDIPSKIVHNMNVKYIMSQKYKEKLIREINPDFLVVQDFTKEFMNMEAEQFFFDYVIGKLGAKAVIVGYDFAFGKKNKGDIPMLKGLCAQNGLDLYVIPPVKANDRIVSSTNIRELILEGKLDEAKSMLGRPFTLYGKVVEGNKLGATIGFPTANMKIEDGQVLPPDGVYITRVELDGREYVGISNLGGKPTVEQSYHALETHIIGYHGNLYQKTIAVEFHKHIRDIKRFESIKHLKKQIALDCLAAMDYFSG